jgi:hypothetical protein
VPTYQQLIVLDGPLSYLPMQDGLVGAGQHPTDLIGTFTPTVGGTFHVDNAGPTINGAVNQAYGCNGGAGNQIVLKAAPAILSGLVNWTIEGWMKIPAAQAGTVWPMYSERDPGGGNNDLLAFSTIGGNSQIGPLYRDNAGTLTYSLANGGVISGSFANCFVADSSWHYWVLTKAAGVFTVYKDASVAVSCNWTGGSTDTLNDPSINNWIFNDQVSNSSLPGSLAHFAIYNKTLSSGVVTSHWNNAQNIGAGGVGSAALRYHRANR